MNPAPTDTLTLLRHCRKLFIRRLEVLARIGVHEFEKVGPQRLWIDVDLYVPYDTTTPSRDHLEEVVDYDFIRAVVEKRIAKGHIGLQETLCDELARELLKHPGVRAVRLSTCKPDVYPDSEAVGVEVFYTQPETTGTEE